MRGPDGLRMRFSDRPVATGVEERVESQLVGEVPELAFGVVDPGHVVLLPSPERLPDVRRGCGLAGQVVQLDQERVQDLQGSLGRCAGLEGEAASHAAQRTGCLLYTLTLP